jgi:hypothetical protein
MLIWSSERREYAVFQELLKSIPGLEGRLLNGTENEIHLVADLVVDHFFMTLVLLTHPLADS